MRFAAIRAVRRRRLVGLLAPMALATNFAFGAAPFLVSVRFTTAELDAAAAQAPVEPSRVVSRPEAAPCWS